MLAVFAWLLNKLIKCGARNTLLCGQSADQSHSEFASSTQFNLLHSATCTISLWDNNTKLTIIQKSLGVTRQPAARYTSLALSLRLTMNVTARRR